MKHAQCNRPEGAYFPTEPQIKSFTFGESRVVSDEDGAVLEAVAGMLVTDIPAPDETPAAEPAPVVAPAPVAEPVVELVVEPAPAPEGEPAATETPPPVETAPATETPAPSV